MKSLLLHFLIITLYASCVGSSNRSASSGGSGTNAVSAYDVTLLSQSACICKSGAPLSNTNGNCFSICSEKPATAQETLYLETFLGPKISLNNDIGTLYNWCKRERRVGGQLITNPDCVLTAESANGGVAELDVTLDQGSQNFSVNVQELGFDQTYIISLIEIGSGLTSNSIQIRKDRNMSNGALGNLTQTGVSRYNCFVNQVANGNFVDNIYRSTYFYSITPPLAIPAGTEGIKCHASYQSVLFDSPFEPRLELERSVLSLWSATDPRFYDNNGNGSIDIHDRIAEVADASEVNIFQSITWDREPPQAQPDNEGEEAEEKLLGYIMAPFVYPETHPQFPLRSYCPGNDEYNGSDPLFREIGSIVGTETEGLYIGRRDQQTIVDPGTSEQVVIPANHLLLKESVLKRIWFHTNASGQKLFPTDDNVRNVVVYFYWPAAPVGTDPHVKLASQEVYRLIDALDSSGGSAPIHDKKIGCIPKSP